MLLIYRGDVSFFKRGMRVFPMTSGHPHVKAAGQLFNNEVMRRWLRNSGELIERILEISNDEDSMPNNFFR